jgi:FAD:protein FMN transferase
METSDNLWQPFVVSGQPSEACRPRNVGHGVPSRTYCVSHPAMATEYSLYLYADSQEAAKRIAEPVFEEIDRVEELLSNYRESSELSRINREASAVEVTTDPETFQFLETSLAWSARSRGAFDITVGKLMKTWGFFGASGALPPEEQICAARNQTGWQKVRLNSVRRTVRFLSHGIELDPGGIGKGYAVDRAIKILRSRHIPTALLSAGSSTIYALGAPPGEPGWMVHVPAPGQETTIVSTIVLRDTSLSTASRSEKYFVDKGHLYGAIMDPCTLRPVEGVLQVTAISPSATDSDALSNALFVAGPQDRALLLEQRPQDSALIFLGNQLTWQHQATRWPAEIANWHRPEVGDSME